MGNYFIEQIEYGRMKIGEVEKNHVIQSIAITRPHRTAGNDPEAYLKIDWLRSGDTESGPPQPYGTPVYPAGNIAEIDAQIREAANHFGCKPEDIHYSFHRPPDDPAAEEAFSNRGHSQLTGEDAEQIFELHEPEDLIHAAKVLGWKRWAFKPTENI